MRHPLKLRGWALGSGRADRDGAGRGADPPRDDDAKGIEVNPIGSNRDRSVGHEDGGGATRRSSRRVDRRAGQDAHGRGHEGHHRGTRVFVRSSASARGRGRASQWARVSASVSANLRARSDFEAAGNNRHLHSTIRSRGRPTHALHDGVTGETPREKTEERKRSRASPGGPGLHALLHLQRQPRGSHRLAVRARPKRSARCNPGRPWLRLS